MSKVGYVLSGTQPGDPNDVLTWHDIEDFRVWVHSKTSGQAREIISVELQVIGSSSPKPSKEEEAVRLKLCMKRQVPKGKNALSASTFRNLPIGQMLDEHSEVISRLLNLSLSGQKRSVQLVEDVSSKSLNLNYKFVWDTKEEINSEDGKSKDAILIAKVYEMLQSSGTRKLSARTAELLGLEVSVVHTAVQVARRNQWLTSNGPGNPGGVLTEKGKKAFHKAGGPERLARIMSMKKEK
jgi:hypothetical protein